jgi:hypothetical protein
VIGVDPHRDTHALAIVDVRTGGVVFEKTSVTPGSRRLVPGAQRLIPVARASF